MNTPLLCETVTGTTTAELVAARDAATRADMVELRLDGVTDPDIAQALHGRRVPVVVTCRPTWEGGRFDGSEEERRRFLTSALDGGAEPLRVPLAGDRSKLALRTSGAGAGVGEMPVDPGEALDLNFWEVGCGLAEASFRLRPSLHEDGRLALEAEVADRAGNRRAIAWQLGRR